MKKSTRVNPRPKKNSFVAKIKGESIIALSPVLEGIYPEGSNFSLLGKRINQPTAKISFIESNWALSFVRRLHFASFPRSADSASFPHSDK